MIVQLGNVVLDDHLLLNGIETAVDISTSTVVTLGGVSVTSTMALSGGRRLSLVSVHDQGLWGKFLYSQVVPVKELASQGQELTLIHPMGTFQVLIISTAGLLPLRKKSNPQPDDLYTGSIELIEV